MCPRDRLEAGSPTRRIAVLFPYPDNQSPYLIWKDDPGITQRQEITEITGDKVEFSPYALQKLETDSSDGDGDE